MVWLVIETVDYEGSATLGAYGCPDEAYGVGCNLATDRAECRWWRGSAAIRVVPMPVGRLLTLDERYSAGRTCPPDLTLVVDARADLGAMDMPPIQPSPSWRSEVTWSEGMDGESHRVVTRGYNRSMRHNARRVLRAYCR